MKFRNLHLRDWFIVLKPEDATEHRIMYKLNELQAQYTASVDSRGAMIYDRTVVLLDLNMEVVKISRVGIIPGYI